MAMVSLPRNLRQSRPAGRQDPLQHIHRIVQPRPDRLRQDGRLLHRNHVTGIPHDLERRILGAAIVLVGFGKALDSVAHAKCFIANSVNFPVDNEPTIEVEHSQ